MTANSSPAANLIGSVRAEGKSGAGSDVPAGEYSSHKFQFAERVDYSSFKEFVVSIEGPVGAKPVPPEKPLSVGTRHVVQKGAQFDPHVVPVVLGTTIEWPNYDEIYHNVFSISEAKQFDLDLYKGNPPEKRVTFDKPGRVDVFCSIHANMHCVVLVMENPYFAVTDSRGHYSITNVPPGTYKLKAWHERMPPQIKEIQVPENGDVKTDFLLTIANLPKY